jgi:hypothetical protein
VQTLMDAGAAHEARLAAYERARELVSKEHDKSGRPKHTWKYALHLILYDQKGKKERVERTCEEALMHAQSDLAKKAWVRDLKERLLQARS